MKSFLFKTAVFALLMTGGMSFVQAQSGATNEGGVQLKDLGVQPQNNSDLNSDYQQPAPAPRKTWIEKERQKADYRKHNEVTPYFKAESNPRTGEIDKVEGGIVIPN